MRVTVFCEDGGDVWLSGISGNQVELSIHHYVDGIEAGAMCVILNKRQCQELGIAAMTVLKTELFIEGTDTEGLF